ncbi:MAG: aminotransferase class V [Saprospiraceae bacterium]|nr:MAG: aminotransferase class V [Saprospiraceae bacterium]
MNPLPPIEALRADTPGCAHVVHLNNAGASLPPRPVIEAIEDYRREEHVRGGYETMAARAGDINRFYRLAARLVGGHPRNMAFAASATDAFNKALSSIPFQAGDSLVTTDDDYVSNHIAFMVLRKRFGVQVYRAAKRPEGGVDVDSVEELLRRHKPRAVSVTHVPTNSGLIQPVETIGQLCRQYDCWYLVDACQSAGQLPLDVQTIGCDFLSATMRKFMRGPRGAGFLYVSDRALEAGLEPLFPDLHGAQWTAPDAYRLADTAIRYEYFEKPFELVLGSAAAIDYALKLGLEPIAARVAALADYTRSRLRQLPGVRVLDKGQQLCGIVTCTATHWDKQTIVDTLHAAGINHSTQGRHNAVIDFDEKGVSWALRISPHYYNTEAEVDLLVDTLSRLKP